MSQQSYRYSIELVVKRLLIIFANYEKSRAPTIGTIIFTPRIIKDDRGCLSIYKITHPTDVRFVTGRFHRPSESRKFCATLRKLERACMRGYRVTHAEILCHDFYTQWLARIVWYTRGEIITCPCWFDKRIPRDQRYRLLRWSIVTLSRVYTSTRCWASSCDAWNECQSPVYTLEGISRLYIRAYRSRLTDSFTIWART